MSFDPYRKWLGIPADRRPPTYYDLLGITEGENDSDVIRSAIEQRRAYIQSKRGEGQDGHVRVILGLFEQAASTLLVPEFKDGYDRQLGLHLKGRRKTNRRSYLLPTWMESRVVRIYGEGSGIVGDLFGIVAIIFGAFALMAYLSFTLQSQATKSDEPRELTWMEKAAGVGSITEAANPVKDAKEQVTRIEATLAKLEEVVKAAKAERNGLAVKLKGMGINSASDVKGNPLAKRTAEDIGRLSNEIESQEKKAVALASKLLQAKAILRRMELEQSGLSEQELNKLALQLHETDKTEDGWSQPINPIDIDQAVDKALAASGPVVAKSSPESSRQETNGVVSPTPANTSVEDIAKDADSSGNLFDGNSFDGWRFVAAQVGQNIPSLQDAWGIESVRGVLFAKGVGSSWLTTKRKISDFNLQFEWRFPPNSKIGPNGSGMVVRANGINETGYDPRGIEIDLSDSDRLGAFLCYDAGMSSSKGIAKDSGVGLLEPISKPKRKPVGDWNTAIIESHGRELTVYINGKKVNQGKTDLLSSGEICLRSQNTAVEFRDIRFTSSRHSNEYEVASQAKDSVTERNAHIDPFRQSSVWSAGGLKMSVLERRGGTFRAKLENSEWSRIVKGTVNEGKVTWLAKDVQPIKGGTGGDNFGTISKDEEGYRMDVEWKQANGQSGSGTYRLIDDPKPDEPKPESPGLKTTGCRVIWTISEAGDSTLTISRPLEKRVVAKDTLVRHEDGTMEFQYDLNSEASIGKALMGEGEGVKFDKSRKSLVLTPKKDGGAKLCYGKLTQLPLTLDFDLEVLDSSGGVTVVASINRRDKDVEFPVLNLVSKDNFKNSAVVSCSWVSGRDAKGSAQFDNRFAEQTVQLGEPKEFKFTIPRMSSDQPCLVYIGLRGSVPISIPRLMVRGRLKPLLGISLSEKNGAVLAEKVSSKGLGETVGIKPGDVFASINGIKPKSSKEATEALGKISFGEESEIVVNRGGKSVNIGFTAE